MHDRVVAAVGHPDPARPHGDRGRVDADGDPAHHLGGRRVDPDQRLLADGRQPEILTRYRYGLRNPPDSGDGLDDRPGAPVDLDDGVGIRLDRPDDVPCAQNGRGGAGEDHGVSEQALGVDGSDAVGRQGGQVRATGQEGRADEGGERHDDHGCDHRPASPAEASPGPRPGPFGHRVRLTRCGRGNGRGHHVRWHPEGEVEAGVLPEDPLMQGLDLTRRLDPELVVEGLPELSVGQQGVRLTAGPVKREHPHRGQVLTQRVPRDEGVERAEHGMTERHLRLDPELGGRHSRLLQAGRQRHHEPVHRRKIGEHVPAPQRESAGQPRRRDRGVGPDRRATRGYQLLETPCIDGHGCRLEAVAARGP